ncbi:mucin-22-like [Ptychodera flava]|uniref:mucin-22-like n=1 Tax=Ptychodera flava TaxID=63121 RepID=UPI003969CBA8
MPPAGQQPMPNGNQTLDQQPSARPETGESGQQPSESRPGNGDMPPAGQNPIPNGQQPMDQRPDGQQPDTNERPTEGQQPVDQEQRPGESGLGNMDQPLNGEQPSGTNERPTDGPLPTETGQQVDGDDSNNGSTPPAGRQPLPTRSQPVDQRPSGQQPATNEMPSPEQSEQQPLMPGQNPVPPERQNDTIQNGDQPRPDNQSPENPPQSDNQQPSEKGRYPSRPIHNPHESNDPEAQPGNPRPPAQGHFLYRPEVPRFGPGEFPDGTLIFFECNIGEFLDGMEVVKCHDGQWNGIFPVCQDIMTDKPRVTAEKTMPPEDGNRPRDEPVSTQTSLTGATSVSPTCPPVETTEGSCEERTSGSAFSSTLVIEEGLEWDDELVNAGSCAYYSMSSNLGYKLAQVFNASSLTDEFNCIQIDSFSQGSVEVNYNVVFEEDANVTEADVKVAMSEGLNNTAVFEELKIDAEAIEFVVVIPTTKQPETTIFTTMQEDLISTSSAEEEGTTSMETEAPSTTNLDKTISVASTVFTTLPITTKPTTMQQTTKSATSKLTTVDNPTTLLTTHKSTQYIFTTMQEDLISTSSAEEERTTSMETEAPLTTNLDKTTSVASTVFTTLPITTKSTTMQQTTKSATSKLTTVDNPTTLLTTHKSTQPMSTMPETSRPATTEVSLTTFKSTHNTTPRDMTTKFDTTKTTSLPPTTVRTTRQPTTPNTTPKDVTTVPKTTEVTSLPPTTVAVTTGEASTMGKTTVKTTVSQTTPSTTKPAETTQADLSTLATTQRTTSLFTTKHTTLAKSTNMPTTVAETTEGPTTSSEILAETTFRPTCPPTITRGSCQGTISGQSYRSTLIIEVGIEWKDALVNPRTCEYGETAAQLSSMLAELFNASALSDNFNCINVDSFTRGSVHVTYDVVVKQTAEVVEEDVAEAFKEGMNNTETFKEMVVNTDVVEFVRVVPTTAIPTENGNENGGVSEKIVIISAAALGGALALLVIILAISYVTCNRKRPRPVKRFPRGTFIPGKKRERFADEESQASDDSKTKFVDRFNNDRIVALPTGFDNRIQEYRKTTMLAKPFVIEKKYTETIRQIDLRPSHMPPIDYEVTKGNFTTPYVATGQEVANQRYSKYGYYD